MGQKDDPDDQEQNERSYPESNRGCRKANAIRIRSANRYTIEPREAHNKPLLQQFMSLNTKQTSQLTNVVLRWTNIQLPGRSWRSLCSFVQLFRSCRQTNQCRSHCVSCRDGIQYSCHVQTRFCPSKCVPVVIFLETSES